MSRPRSEAEYLARFVPRSAAATSLGRRTFLRGAAGAASLAAVPALAACGGGSDAAATGAVSFGSNQSDETPKAAVQAIVDAYLESSDNTVTINTVDHETFQNNISNYLQGKPDDVFTWFAGYRMRFFAEQGLVGDISDVWSDSRVSGISQAFKDAATGDDGKQYLVPIYNYPWAMFYRPSVWQKYGYTVPTTLDDLTTLAAAMQDDGLTPIAFSDKEGWEAMGTFDILNMRINGYDFHVDLMAGNQSWTSSQVKEVFQTWKTLLPYHQADSLGRTWQEAAQGLQQGKAGMYFLGSFVSQQVDDGEDLDMFVFPEIDSAIGSGAIDAPIDGFMMSADPADEAAAKDFLAFLGGADAGSLWVKNDPSNVLANTDADTSGYTDMQTKAAELINSSTEIAQFLDRDTRPDFASTVMIPQLQAFIKDSSDIDGILEDIESQKQSIFTS